MKGVEIRFDKQSPQMKNEPILISIDSEEKEEFLYKFFIGFNGIWTSLQEFHEDNYCTWIPDTEGKYNIMVQVKRKDSKKAFDFLAKADYIIGDVEENIIKDVYLNQGKFTLGEKINIMVEANKIPLMYKYWLRGENGWELVKDYCPENNLTITANAVGIHEILIECKKLDSESNFDDFKKIEFEVENLNTIEIVDFKCLSNDILVGEELIFQVESKQDEGRAILYKFIKIDSKGSIKCIQDYSTKTMVSYIEKESGDYKLLCMAKDMYSNKEYDDRAIIIYTVIPYLPVQIKEFTTDVSSPQICGNSVLLKAVAEGGKNLLYRFIIDGNYGEDSGYIKSNNYFWKTKKHGNYKIKLQVKDASYDGEYEDLKEIEYEINDRSNIPIKINEIIYDKKAYYLKNKPINAKVYADGGLELKYSFIVYKDGNEIEKIDYGDCNWVNFIPENSGEYELEIRVKDKYSDKSYDCHSNLFLNVKDYAPGIIDYVLLNSKEYYMVGDTIALEVVAENTKNVHVKYILKVNGYLVEETDFIKNKKYTFTPKCSGKYVIEIQAKSKYSKENYDSKKILKFLVHDATPVTNTKIASDKAEIYINEGVTFKVQSQGGKDVCYEFYIMERGEWRLVQKYSKKNYYGFMPFIPGKYKLLVLSKSSYKKCAYEDYDIFQFEASENLNRDTNENIIEYQYL